MNRGGRGGVALKTVDVVEWLGTLGLGKADPCSAREGTEADPLAGLARHSLIGSKQVESSMLPTTLNRVQTFGGAGV